MDDYEITCAQCFVTMRGKDRQAVQLAFRGHEKEAHGFMTGQEFYNRLMSELPAVEDKTMIGRKVVGLYPAEVVMAAAKRAAGLL